MPTPVPEPTIDELETFAEIAIISSDGSLAVVSKYDDQELTDLKWSRTISDIDEWSTAYAARDDVKKLGEIEFFEGKDVETRLDLRNKVRRRYGLPELLSETGVMVTTSSSSAAVAVGLDW